MHLFFRGHVILHQSRSFWLEIFIPRVFLAPKTAGKQKGACFRSLNERNTSKLSFFKSCLWSLNTPFNPRTSKSPTRLLYPTTPTALPRSKLTVMTSLLLPSTRSTPSRLTVKSQSLGKPTSAVHVITFGKLILYFQLDDRWSWW